MIAFVQGKLVEALPTMVVVDVHGVGYELLIPLSSFDRLPAAGNEVKLLTHLAIREDAHTLYGFITPQERDLFRMLVHTVSGIGPKIALNVLSGISINAFRAAVGAGDIKALSQISGVGKKTAERIVVELKDKLGGFGSGTIPTTGGSSVLSDTDQRQIDAIAALAALGFKQNEAFDAVRASLAILGPQAGVEALVRASLKKGA